ncbi:DUF1491 family protein [Hyphococcus luteus]|uniref:DUF1491 domain-containing protein n=1 Tax=Hyphococcus luteus TaxID=2058213 RepID=A0A2S7JZY2_9PROT|nr:DUF1491 family protein [Marinicaulis flavus]PQA85807.1 DUF1491 domain-containing protein [Marinicaulis flavus]
MTEPRLKTEIRVSAQLRRAQGEGAFAVVVRRGDPDAGAVAVKLYQGPGAAKLYVQSRDLDGNPVWREPFEEESSEDIEAKIDRWLEKEVSIDPDLWVVEIEDREGRAFLD